MDILQKIIDLDKAAAARVSAYADEQNKLLGESGEAAAKAKQEVLERERKNVESLRAQQSAALAEKQSSAESVRAAQRKKVDDAFAANRQAWETDILKKVTGV